MKLAIDGGKPAVTEWLRPFKTIDGVEERAIYRAMASPLSGFLGGQERGGYRVNKLEEQWCEIFGVKHAVACNSGTSGLLMACMAAGVQPGDKVHVPCFTMSATAAAPAFLGADIIFSDIDRDYFCFNAAARIRPARAMILTNLFGHPAELFAWRRICDLKGIVLIEDNAQAIFAMEGLAGTDVTGAKYAGTIGHMGVFSANVHKHLQAGEGGVVVTNDDDMAARLRAARNHGEMSGALVVGLNLRMTEVTAAIVLAQLSKRHQIMSERIEIAEAMTDAVKGLPGIIAPKVREGCTHSYYVWALRIAHRREWFVQAMNAEGVPIRAGYVAPLYRLPAFKQYARECSVAERMHDQELVVYENCAWSPSSEQLKQFKEAFEKVVTAMVEKAA